MHITKKLTALFLAFLMVISLIPSNALGVSAAEVSGSDTTTQQTAEITTTPTTTSTTVTQSDAVQTVPTGTQPSKPTGTASGSDVLPTVTESDTTTPTTTNEGATTSSTTSVPQETPEINDDPTPNVPSDQEEATTAHLTVYFLFEDGSVASKTLRAEYEIGASYDVEIPTISGYVAYQGSSVADAALTGTVDKDTSIEITYKPKNVEYIVHHKVQQLDGTYTTYDETLTGNVGDDTNAQPKSDYQTGRSYSFTGQVVIVESPTVELTITYNLNKCYVNFNTDGGSYVARMSGFYGATVDISEVTVPTKSGYTFDGWYDNAECNGSEISSVALNGDQTVYAKWVPGTASYTVIYWQENANDSNYTVHEVGSGAGTVGSNATFTPKSYEGFELNSTKTDAEAVTIAADGSTIKNVYYSRKSYTLTFRKISYSWGSEVAGSVIATYNFKYGQSTASASQWIDSDYRWKVALNSDEGYSEAPAMPNRNLTVYGEDNDADYKYITFYYEYVDGKKTTTEIKASYTQYLDDNDYYATDVDHIAIPGFNYITDGDTNGGNYYGAYDSNLKAYVWKFYYERQSFALEFRNGNQYGTTVLMNPPASYKYGADISGANYTPTSKPSGVPDYVDFVNWYTDPSCAEGTLFVFDGATMPASKLILYAKWQPKTFTVTFESNGGTEVASQSVLGGETASAPDAIEKEGYEFLGWYSNEACTGDEYDFNSRVTSDITLYAGWEELTETRYTIQYLLKSDNSELFDSVQYTGIVGATVNALAKSHGTYIADQSSKSLELTHKEADNVITFYYDLPQHVYYIVRYMCGDTILAEEDPVSTDSTQVVVNAKPELVPGYELDSTRRTVKLANETTVESIKENIIVFTCELKDDLAYTVNHHLYGTDIAIKDSTIVENQTFGAKVTVPVPDIDGYTAVSTAQEITINLSDNEVTYYYKKNVTVTADDVTKAYSDSLIGGESATASGLYGNDTLDSVEILGGKTNVGTYNDELTVGDVVIMRGSTDVTEQYVVTKVAGNLTITVLKITLTAASDEKEYDGTPLENDEYSIDGAFAGDDLSAAEITVTGSITLPGTVDNVITCTISDTDIAKNYDISTENGKLTVTKNSIDLVITSGSAEKVYDGKPLSNSDITVEGELCEGDSVDYTLPVSITDIGEADNTFGTAKIVNNGVDVTDAYNSVTFKEGTLKVTGHTELLEITTADDTKEFDGTPLSNSDYEITEGALDEGDTLEVTVTGSRTNVGTAENTFDYVIYNAEGTDVTVKYTNISAVCGTLEVTPVEITVTAASDSKVYDGTPLSNSDYEFDGTLPDGYELVVTIEGEITNVGSVENKVTYIDAVASSSDVPAVYAVALATQSDDIDAGNNFSFTTVNGTLTIEAREITITAASDEKEYDGTALVNSEWTLTSGELADGDTIDSVTVTGTQTDVGKSANVASDAVIINGEGEDVTANYVISYTDGILSVTASISSTVPKTGDNNSDALRMQLAMTGFGLLMFALVINRKRRRADAR